MIDTVILTMQLDKTLVTDPDKFTPSLRWLKESDRGFGARLFTKYTQNINQKYGYYPRLTVTPRWKGYLEIPLKIEFSVPKLLYGNNLDEVSEDDFERVIEVLQSKLKEMGIRVFPEQLRNALVSAVHYSKNIPLSHFVTASWVISVLSKLDVTKRLELNHRHFKNQGHALYFDCGSYQIVIYDKLKDIGKSKRHAVDKEPTSEQLGLFDFIKKNKIPAEILRIEIRLVQKGKLNSLFTQFGYPANPTFKQIFNSEIARKVLHFYWDFIANEKSLFLLKATDQDTLKQVIEFQRLNKRKLSTIETLGIAQIIEYSKTNGLRTLRESLSSFYSDRNWFRQQKYFDLIEKITADKKPYDFVTDIENTLNTLKPYRIENDLIKGEES
ncbi:hypothetical protein HYW46_06545 [Candidatus Daviesbacteria bacterium]|nr:hypothetical protein [Candidatus Daviesbacteria bacterium]